jgi:hypothetical protein
MAQNLFQALNVHIYVLKFIITVELCSSAVVFVGEYAEQVYSNDDYNDLFNVLA